MSGSKLAAAPAWLIEKAKEQPSAPSDSGSDNVTSNPPLRHDERIPYGQRGETLFRKVACRARAEGLDYPAILARVERVNRHQCDPPIGAHPEDKDPRELERIALSACRYPAGNASPGPDAEALAALENVEAAFWRREWSGQTGRSDRDVMVALIKLARRHGQSTPEGVRVVVSYRALTLAAAVSKPTGIKAIKRLKDAGIIKKDDTERKSAQAGAFVLLEPRASLYRTQPEEGYVEEVGESTPPMDECGKKLRAPLTCPRLRWSAPRFDWVGDQKVRSHILRLGKTAGFCIDFLEKAGGSATVEEIADALGVSRVRDLRTRVIARLEARGVVACSGRTVSLVEDWPEAVNRDRAITGEIRNPETGEDGAYERDMGRYNREREGYQHHRNSRPDRAPTSRGMEVAREQRVTERTLRVCAILADPETKPGQVYRSPKHGSNVEVLAGAVAAYVCDLHWRGWVDPVRGALRFMDGEPVARAAGGFEPPGPGALGVGLCGP